MADDYSLHCVVRFDARKYGRGRHNHALHQADRRSARDRGLKGLPSTG